MGKLIRAAIGFAVALTLLQGKSVWSEPDTQPLSDVRADIAQARPGAKLHSLVDEGASALAARFGTAVRDSRAHGLHS